MGVDLTKQLFSRHAAGLTAGEIIVLAYMCLVALDKENDRGQRRRETDIREMTEEIADE